MWFLVQGRWYYVFNIAADSDVRDLQQKYRANGIPIEAIARRKPSRGGEMRAYDND